MTTTQMTGNAKKQLSKTIRGLREDLLKTLGEALEGEYLLSVPLENAGLSERHRVRRVRLESWLDEQVRSVPSKKQDGARERFIKEVLKEAAYTWLNRLVVLRLLEANGHTQEQVVTNGWSSGAQERFLKTARVLSRVSDTEGYATLLRLVFDELSLEMPGLFGDVGLVNLVPMPPAMLRRLVKVLNDGDLDSCWTDDTTLGWIYQYWNDPEREELDAKLNSGGKVEPHEIGSKTQLFTERYMVEWLLQNSLNPMWLAICRKNGWTPECESDGVLDRLETRREEWRTKREAEEVAREDLMRIYGDAEERWKYWVPQPMPEEIVEQAPTSLRELKLLDPACGSGHFLVAALGLLFAFYREEARHRCERWSDAQIATWILEDNLHGIDIDPRAVQLAAAALTLAARNACGEAMQIDHLNLVAPALRLAALPDNDEAIVELRQRIHEETGLAETLTNDILGALEGADHLGTLLRIDDAITEALREHLGDGQGDLLAPSTEAGLAEDSDAMRHAILAHLDAFLSQHATAQDLGLRLRGEQLATGVRFLELMREGSYDIVVGNPPYQGTSKMRDKEYIKKHYPRGKADLFACFLERGLELAREGGVSAMVTMRNWMFIKQYQDLREHLLENYTLPALADLDSGAFEEISAAQVVVSVALAPFWRIQDASVQGIAIRPTPPEDKASKDMIWRKRAGMLAHHERFEFQTEALRGIEGWPLVYWWGEGTLVDYMSSELVGNKFSPRKGMITSDDTRFLRLPWELDVSGLYLSVDFHQLPTTGSLRWMPYIKGASGAKWLEPLRSCVKWHNHGLEVKSLNQFKYTSYTRQIMNESYYGLRGVAYSTIGSSFSVRAHKYSSIIGSKGSSIYPNSEHGLGLEHLLCVLNSTSASRYAQDLNPSIDFTKADIVRVPLSKDNMAGEIVSRLMCVFGSHEESDETSCVFKLLAHSDWAYAQDWAQRAVDRPKGAPLPDWEPEHEDPTPEQWVSWSIGVAIGRFDREEGLADETPEGALPAGILFLSEATEEDSLSHEACDLLHEQWEEHGDAINRRNSLKTKEDLRMWMRKRFFDDVHRPMYENAPIYFPLSSSNKSFVAYVSIHRWTPDTLRILQADHLLPERQRIEGQIDDLRAMAEDERSRDDQKRLDNLLSWLEELNDFIDMVEQCAEKGPPPPDSKTPEREVDARYEPVLDDGTMINAAGVWPLLDPLWKKYPKTWWKQLSRGKGRNDYDWSMLAARYFPTRVDKKCKEDPSLAVAHGCFWRYHPERAYAWELRLQHEIEEDFTIDEDNSDAHRQAFLDAHPERAAELREEELKRRLRKAKKDDEEVDEEELRAQLELTLAPVVELHSTTEDTWPNIAASLQTLRKEQGWSVEYVVNKLQQKRSITRDEYLLWERGSKKPHTQALHALAALFEVSTQDILSGVDWGTEEHIHVGSLAAARSEAFEEGE